VSARKLEPDWISKTLAGGVLGYGLALALIGLAAWIGPGGIDAANKGQFNMWMITPLWLLFFSTVYLFRSGWQAIAVLGAANVVGHVALYCVRQQLAG